MRTRTFRIGAVAIAALGALWTGGVAAAGGGCMHSVAPSTGSGTRVEMLDGCFTATVLHVDLGARVTFVNRDATEHNIVGVGGTWGDTDHALRQGDRATYRFDDVGVFPYACWYHPGMIGAIVVGDGTGTGFGGVTEAAAPVTNLTSSGPTAAAPSGGNTGWWIAAFAALTVAAGGLIARERRAGRRSHDPQAAGTP